MLQQYELLAILPGTLTEEEAKNGQQIIKDVLAQYQGVDVTEKTMGKNRLSYPMKHIRYGYFYFFTCRLDTTQVGLVDKKLRLLPNILRFVLRIHDSSLPAPRLFSDLEKEAVKVADEVAPVAIPEEMVASEAVVANTAPVVESKPKKVAAKKEEVKEVSMEEIDQKLDDILDKTISSL